ncbi:MAG: hypothetical protein GX613_16905, partial [Chloroflexi bacterium]|nr:hypothetical protein [Chloroflexota bacterium]
TVYGGDMLYPIEVAREVYTRYRDWIKDAPDDLTTAIVTMNFPPIPQVPDFLRGKSAVILRGCYVGPVEEGEALFQSWLEWMPPIASSFRAMPFTEVASISKDPQAPTAAAESGAWLRDLDDETIDTILQYAISREGSSPLVITEVRHVGGAVSRVAANANAFGHRDTPLVLNLIAMLPSADLQGAAEAYMAGFKQALGAHLAGSYMNFLGAYEAQEQTVNAYSQDAYRRLTAVKAAYDPDNLFRFSFPIPPAREA